MAMKKNKQIVDGVIDRFNASAETREQYEDVWKQNYKQYRGINTVQRQSSEEGRSKLNIPKPFEIIENVMPSLFLSLISSRPTFRYADITGNADEIDTQIFDAMTNIIDEQFYDNEGTVKLYSLLKKGAIFGTSVAKVIPKFNRKGEFLFPDFLPVNIVDIFLDWFNVLEPRFIIHRVFRSPSQIKKNIDAGFYDKEAGMKAIDQASNFSQFFGQPLDRQQLLQGIDRAVINPRTKLVEILEYWGEFDLDGDGIDEEVQITIANGNNILVKRPNPLKTFDERESIRPFVIQHFIPNFEEPYGISLLEPATDLFEELNTKRNQRIDNVNRIIDPPILINRLAQLDLSALKKRTGSLILFSPANKINPDQAMSPFLTPDATGRTLEESNVIIREIENTLGVSPVFAGQPAQRRETATTTLALQQASTKRFQSILELFAVNLMRKIGKLMFVMNQNFMTSKIIKVTVNEDEGRVVPVKLTKKDIEKNFKLFISFSSSIGLENKQVRLNSIFQLIRFLGSLSPQLLAQQGTMIDFEEIGGILQKEMGIDIQIFKKIRQPASPEQPLPQDIIQPNMSKPEASMPNQAAITRQLSQLLQQSQAGG